MTQTHGHLNLIVQHKVKEDMRASLDYIGQNNRSVLMILRKRNCLHKGHELTPRRELKAVRKRVSKRKAMITL